MKSYGKEKNNCHYRDCEAITDNLSRIIISVIPDLIGYLSRIKNKKRNVIARSAQVRTSSDLRICSSPCKQGDRGDRIYPNPCTGFKLKNNLIGRSLEFFRVSRKNRDDSSFSTPAALVPIFALAAVLSFSVVSESRAEAGCSNDYALVKGECTWCGNGVKTCHYDTANEKIVVDSCHGTMAVGNNACHLCGGYSVNSCRWDEEKQKAVATSCGGGYAVLNDQCLPCQGTCHWDEDNQKVVIDKCWYGYVLGNGTCHSCGDHVKTCYWDEEKQKAVATGCGGEAVLLNDRCQLCGGGIICGGSGETRTFGGCYSNYAFGNGKCNHCGNNVKTCHWDEEKGKVVADSCYSNYVLGNGTCNYCGNYVKTCHWDEEQGKVVTDSCYSNYAFGNGTCNYCGNNVKTCHWDEDGSKVLDSCSSGYIINGSVCEPCSKYGGKAVSTGGKTYYVNNNGGTYNAYLPDSNGGCSKMTCTDAQMTDCTTEQFDNQGRPVAEYDENNELLGKYDYDDKGSLMSIYNDQCKVDSCAGSYREQGGSCVTSCGTGWRDMGSWCNHVQWTPAEAAAVLTDDNNNSVTITFKK